MAATPGSPGRQKPAYRPTPPAPPFSPIRCEVLRAQVLMHMQLQGEGDFTSPLDQVGQQGIDEDDDSHHLKKLFGCGGEDILHALVTPYRYHEVASHRLHADGAAQVDESGEEEQKSYGRRKPNDR